MADKAVFLDRDNTIIANDGYLGDPTKVRLLPGAAAAIASMRRLGYRIIVVSNQSGVAKGLFDEAAVEAVNQEMIRQLREQAGAHVDAEMVQRGQELVGATACVLLVAAEQG